MLTKNGLELWSGRCDDEVYDDVDDDDDYECVCDVDGNDDVIVATMMCAMLIWRPG